MSKYRPHVATRPSSPPLPDKFKMGVLTPQQRAEWLRKQPKEVQNQSLEMRDRFQRIEQATEVGLLGWERDHNHYRNGTPYCKCPGGTVAAHNERFDGILAGVKTDG